MAEAERNPKAVEAGVKPSSTQSSEGEDTARKGGTVHRVKEYLMMNVDPAQATVPLASYCFMTGFNDAMSFSAVFIWCGFQTGNSVQLALALARLFNGPPGQRDLSFHTADSQALTSLLSFLFGAFLGRIGDKMGNNTRLWLFTGTFIQALFTMAAAIAIWQSHTPNIADSRGDPSWHNPPGYVGLGFASAAIGLQGIMGKRVNSQFATTVVLTTVWCELMCDPGLFRGGWVRSRDHRIIAVLALVFGGFVGRAILQAIGSAAGFGIGAGLRVLIALAWLRVPAKPPAKPKEK